MIYVEIKVIKKACLKCHIQIPQEMEFCSSGGSVVISVVSSIRSTEMVNGYKHLLFQKTGISFPAPLSVDSVPAAGNLTPFLAPWTPTLDTQIDAYACNENNNWVRAPVTGTIC